MDIVNHPIVHKTGPKGPTGPQAKTLLKRIPEDISLLIRKVDNGFVDNRDHLARELTVTKSAISALSHQVELLTAKIDQLLAK